MPKSVKPIEFKLVLRNLFIFLIVIGTLFGVVHLFLFYRANSLLKAFIEQVSDGNYTALAKKVRFGYLPFRIKATDIRFYPLDTTQGSRLYYLQGDTLQMKLTSLIPILFYNSLEVKEVRLVKPNVEVISDGSRNNDRVTGFNASLKEIKDGLLKSLDLLQVDKCEIIDGGFKIVRPDVAKVLAVNHINLTIDSLLAAKKGMLTEKGDTVSVHFLLDVKHPDILIPDSNYFIDMDRLFIDSKRNNFEINELRFSKNKFENALDTIQLSSIVLKGLHWDNLLDNGVIELDSLFVKNGIAKIDLTDRMLFNKKAEAPKVNPKAAAGLPFIFHYASVQQVSYQLRSKRKRGPFTLLLDGDSLVVNELALMNQNGAALRLGSLSLNVKNFQDQDDKKTYLAGFERLFLKGNNLFIENYSLKPMRMQAFSANNVLKVPEIKLSNYSLSELLSGKLEANRLDLKSPTIIIDVLGTKENNSVKKNGLQQFFNRLDQIQPNLNINQLGIENARIVLQPQKSISDTIVISELTTEINLSKLFDASSLEDLFMVTEGVSSEGFFITGSRFQFKVTGALVSPANNFLGMNKLEGKLDNGLEIDFDHVQVKGRPGELMIPVDGYLPLSSLYISSGKLSYLQHPKRAADFIAKKKAPVLSIDSVLADNLSVFYKGKKEEEVKIVNLSMNFLGLTIDNNQIKWIDALAEGKGLRFGLSNYHLAAGTWHGSFPGMFTLEDVTLYPLEEKNEGVKADVKKLEIPNKLNFIGEGLNAVEEVNVFNPNITITKTVNTEDKTIPYFAKGFSLPKLSIINPIFNGTLVQENGEVQQLKLNGGIVDLFGLQVFSSNDSSISVSRVKMDLPNPHLAWSETWQLKPSNLKLTATNLLWAPGKQLQGLADTVEMEGIGKLPVFKDSSQSLWVNKAGVSQWRFPLATDSFLYKLDALPPWWIEGANFSSSGKNNKFAVFNISVNNQTNELCFDSLMLRPNLSKDSFMANQPFQKDFITLHTGSGKLYKWKQVDGSLKGGYVQKVKLDYVDLFAARDKRLPQDTLAYRPLLARKLQELPIALSIDTVEISDGMITYEEVGEKWGLPGEFIMDRLWGYAYGFTTMDTQVQDSLVLDIRARIFGATPMGLQFAQSYSDSLQSFRFNVQLGSWRMAAANPLIAPLNSFAFTRGHSDTMWLKAWGNDHFAYGYTGFGYRKMRMGVLKEGHRRDYFFAGPTNFFANLILVNNNKGTLKPFYVDRLRNKAIFNYWSKMVSGAMTTSMGVPGLKKKARKGMKKQGISAKREG